jgi:hypothetical protein
MQFVESLPALLAEASLTQGTSQEELTAWLLVPLAIGFAALIVAFVLYYRYVEPIDKWLGEFRRRRNGFALIFCVVVPIAAGVVADIADLSEVIDGRIDCRQSMLLSAASVLAITYAWGQLVIWRHSDTADEVLAREKLRADADREYLHFVLQVDAVFGAITEHRVNRLRKLIEEIGELVEAGEPLPPLHCIGDPKAQIAAIIQATHGVFQPYLGKLNPAASLRVVHFQPEDGFLRPTHSWNGVTESCVQSPTGEHRSWFQVDRMATRCLAVAAFHSGQIMVVEDAAAAAADSRQPFSYFSADQQDRIKSIIVLPIFSNVGIRQVRWVISVDTDQAGFFKQRHAQLFEVLRRNLEKRLNLETEASRLCGIVGWKSQQGAVLAKGDGDDDDEGN